MQFWRDWFTGKDNKHYELGRALWALGTIALIAFQGIAVYLKAQVFSPLEFGGAVGAILAAGGFGIRMKQHGGEE